MSGVFFTSPLTRTATQGGTWAKVDAYFPELQVFANVLLSRFGTQTPERFTPFQLSRVEAYIVTPETPMTSAGTVSFPTRLDNTVYLKTDRLTFWLAVNNGSSAMPGLHASAVGIIYDTSAAAAFDMAEVVDRFDLAVYADDGTVVGTHRSYRLDGGPDIDRDRVVDSTLAEIQLASNRPASSLRVATFGYGKMPEDTDFRVDPATGRAEEVAPLGV